MTMLRWRRILPLVLLVALLALPAADSAGLSPAAPGAARSRQDRPGGSTALRPAIGQSLQHDRSPALRTLTPSAPQGKALRELPGRLLPKTAQAQARQPAPHASSDPILQSTMGPAAMPAPLQNFAGLGNVNNVLPPDMNGAVGPQHYVQMVNLSFAIWDKSGRLLYGPAASNTLWQGFGGICESHNDGDPIVLYDHLADRWLMSQFALSFPGSFHQCIAVSTTSDPTGAWHRYDFLISTGKMNDFPKLSVWPDGYYLSINQYDGQTYDWAGAGALVFERQRMLQGLPARQVAFDLLSVNPEFGGILPANLDGPPPPQGTPNFFAQVDDSSWLGPTDALRIWRFAVDWEQPERSTFGQAGAPDALLPTAPFDPLPCMTASPPTRDCIPQPNVASSAYLDGLGSQLMYRLVYRHFGSHDVLLMNHTVNAGDDRAAIRWYELRDPGGEPVIHQQGTYAPAGAEHRWLGSLAMDRLGNLALAYSASSTAIFPAIRYAGRQAGDPPGTLPLAEVTLQAGGGSQTSSSSRWGDYMTLVVDPSDDCTFWLTSQYYPYTSLAGWHTRIGAFQFPNCNPAPAGQLAGQVSDARSGVPLSGALVRAGAYSTLTDARGRYQFLSLPAGSYDLSVSLYGYAASSSAGVLITPDAATEHDLALQRLALVSVRGRVVDGSGHGWPLYARIEVEGYPGSPVYTDPATGYYSFAALEDVPLKLSVSALVPGYELQTRPLTPRQGGGSEDFALQVGPQCQAPGYAQVLLAQAPFDQPALPAGWEIVDQLGNGQVWRLDDPGGRGNLTGGSGGFAIVDSDVYGQDGAQDTELRTPVLDLRADQRVALAFDSDFYWYYWGASEVASVDLSTDAGASWSSVWQRSGASARGPQRQVVDLSALAGGRQHVLLRFHYYNASNDYWWQLDNVEISGCRLIPGGLVIGHVYDALTGQAVNAATLRSAVHSSTSGPTPDPALDDGFFSLFVGRGTQPLSATKDFYNLDTRHVDMVADGLLRQNMSIAGGRLELQPQQLEFRLNSGAGALTRTLQISNTGLLAAEFRVLEVAESPQAALPAGPFATHVRRLSPKHLNDTTAQAVQSYTPPPAAPLAAGQVKQHWSTDLLSAWGVGFDTATQSLWVGNRAPGGGDDRNYRFWPDGKPTAEHIDVSAWASSFAADMTYNALTGMLWQVNVGGDHCIYELDPLLRRATGQRICPPVGTSQRGLAHDPLTDTFYSGSWNDGIINHFDAAGVLLDSRAVGLNIAGLAYNPGSGHLFVLVSAASGPDVYVLDVRQQYSIVGAFQIAGLESYQQAGLEIDCAGSLWLVNQASGMMIEAHSGETGTCAWADSVWLSTTRAPQQVTPGAAQPLAVSVDASGLAPGLYQAQLRLRHATPYPVPPLTVRLRVLQAQYIPLLRR